MNDDERLAFRFHGGDTWLNLLATRGRSFSAQPVERLTTPERLREWLDRSELAPALPPQAADLDRARALRETLRALALATASGQPPPPEATADLAAFLTDQPDPVHLVAGERLLRELPPTTGAALARIARQAVDHLTGPGRHALTICAEHDCHWVFADPTGRRRWCPEPACASRGRVRALRARRRSTAPDHP
ncbi:CGNR zinc finger domain-containing protein [Streptosporangium sp. CA-135522]|uniref:CGNR zinc finger domain-containing protein n=1 Tax=Streptosporangium sp. CA-135522 TaxID=3240072 RepID=UPI003D8F4F03